MEEEFGQNPTTHVEVHAETHVAVVRALDQEEKANPGRRRRRCRRRSEKFFYLKISI